MRALPLFHTLAGRPVIVIGTGTAADAKRRLLERAGARVVGEPDPHARLAFIATAEPEAAAGRLKARGVLVNVTDRPDLCDFTVPSLLDRDPLLIAVGTAGASAGLAKHVRLRLERWLPADVGRLAEALNVARERLRELWPAADDRRGALDAALSEGGALDPLADGAADRVGSWLEDPSLPAPGQPVELRLAGDDPDELTVRQARLLGMADALLVEAGIPAPLLGRARADALRLAWPYAGPLPEGMVLILRRA